MFFQLFSTIEVTLAEEMMQRNYVCVVLHMLSAKNG